MNITIIARLFFELFTFYAIIINHSFEYNHSTTYSTTSSYVFYSFTEKLPEEELCYIFAIL